MALLSKRELANYSCRLEELRGKIAEKASQHLTLSRHKDAYWLTESMAGNRDYIMSAMHILAVEITSMEAELAEVEQAIHNHGVARQRLYEDNNALGKVAGLGYPLQQTTLF
jgi:hypothetical protein